MGMLFSQKKISSGATRKSFVEVDGETRGDDNKLSPTRTTRISPRRAQGRISPMQTTDLRNRRGKHLREKIESTNVSEDESHNEANV